MAFVRQFLTLTLICRDFGLGRSFKPVTQLPK